MVQPSYIGHVSTAFDAALLFEACWRGQLPLVTQRLSSNKAAQLVSSGQVFVYEQQGGGIRRWTDCLTWSPSRVLDEFLVYREVEGPRPRRVEKKEQGTEAERIPEEWTKHLYGSLIDSYSFKVDGLVKKTVAVTVGSCTLRLVCYYTASDILNGNLLAPSADTNLLWITPRNEIQAALTGPAHSTRRFTPLSLGPF